MSNMVYFYLREGIPDSEIRAINRRLKESLKAYSRPEDGEDPALDYRFCTREAVDAWVWDINNNPKSPQAHLKPATRASLYAMFKGVPDLVSPGVLGIDVAFSRCPQPLARILADALDKEPLLLRISSNGADFLAQAGYPAEHPLTKLIEPERAPALNSMRRERPQSGVATFRTVNGEPVCVLYGNVDMPTFLKDDQYVEPEYNGLYRDDRGRPYLLVPLLKVDAQSTESIFAYHKRSEELLIDVHPMAFATILYGAEIMAKPGSPGIIDAFDCLQMLVVLRRKLSGYIDRTAWAGLVFSKKGVARPHGRTKNPNLNEKSSPVEVIENSMAYAATMLVEHHCADPEAVNAMLISDDPVAWEMAMESAADPDKPGFGCPG